VGVTSRVILHYALPSANRVVITQIVFLVGRHFWNFGALLRCKSLWFSDRNRLPDCTLLQRGAAPHQCDRRCAL